MGQVLVDSNSLTAIGDAIRSKNKQIVKYKPNEMAGAIKALDLDNSVVIQSNDAWKYAIDSALEHESITVKVSGKLTGDNTTGYKGEVIFDPYITSNFGWLAGKINKTVDSTNHIITFSAEAATEISGMLQDGWTPVYIVNNQYYTTTTPDNLNSFKRVSSSDNIENLLICGYYTIDEDANKLVAIEPNTNVGPVSNKTKNYQNKYITTIGNDVFSGCDMLTTIDVSNATTIEIGGFGGGSGLSGLKIVDISNATSIGYSIFFLCKNLQYVILNNTTPPSNDDPYTVGKFLIPSSALETYYSTSDWSSYTDYFYAIEDYNIDRTNCTITVTIKATLTKLNFDVNKTTTRETAYFSTEDHSKGTTCTLVNFNPETGEEANIFSIGPDGASLVLDTTGSSEAIRILRNYDLKLAFYVAEKKNGEFNRYNYTKDQKIVTTAGTFTRDIIEFTSYSESGPLYKFLISAFNKGQDLHCVISLLKKGDNF